MKKQEIKELVINNIVYAKYSIDGGTLYLKVIKKIVNNHALASEDIIAKIISSIERKKFSYMAYLNIK